MNIGFVATRLNGTDGVSLEAEKWARVLRRMGHEVFFCAGELGGYAANGALIPLLHFAHPIISDLHRRALSAVPDAGLMDDIRSVASELCEPLRSFIREHRLDLLVVENALAIPMNLPLGLCLKRLLAETGIQAIAHDHDFFWERERYQGAGVLDLLEEAFPPDLPNLRHVTINSLARRRLLARKGIPSVVIPNVHDFAHPPAGVDDYNGDFRGAIGISPDDVMILQPTRVVRRKGIEMTLELARALGKGAVHVVLTHGTSDEGEGYWRWLRHEAGALGVDLRLVNGIVGAERALSGNGKVYSLWDVYPHANLVSYPSLYEGFGNALLEAVYFRKPVVINRYPVYNADIRPLGFEFVELDGFVDERTVEEVRSLLTDPDRLEAIGEKNYRLAQEHFSFEVLEEKLRGNHLVP